jgi:hypothetical protein
VFIRVQVRVRNREFTTSSHSVIERVIGTTCEKCLCDEKIYVRLLQFVRRDLLLGDD